MISKLCDNAMNAIKLHIKQKKSVSTASQACFLHGKDLGNTS